MSDINKVHETLLNRGKILHKKKIVETLQEFSRIISKIDIENTIKYLSRHRYIKRILFSFYYINSYDERIRGFCELEDRELLFSVLNKLGVKWYLGLSSSIYLQGKVWQTPNKLYILNEKISGNKKIGNLNIRFMKIKDKLIFGLKKAKTSKGIGYFYSDPAKTNIDLVYFKKRNKLTRIKNTNKYLKEYPKWVGKK